MSATDTIRAMLDERGVPFKTYVVKLYDVSMEVGTVYSSNGIDWLAIENPDTHRISVTNFKNELTPEQAIEATLGRGECHVESVQQDCNMTRYGWVCDRCHGLTIGFAAPHFCSVCGRKVRA